MPEFPPLSEAAEAEAAAELVEASAVDVFPDWGEAATVEATPPPAVPMAITIAWSLPSGTSTSGRTITIERATDGGAWEAVASGLAPGSSPYTETFEGVVHEPLAGTATSRAHRVRLVRVYDSAVMAEGVSSPVDTFDLACE